MGMAHRNRPQGYSFREIATFYFLKIQKMPQVASSGAYCVHFCKKKNVY